MGVLVKKSDVDGQFRRYEAAQQASQRAAEAFERACNRRRPAEECRAAWEGVGEAERALDAEWQAYRRIAPAKMRTR